MYKISKNRKFMRDSIISTFQEQIYLDPESVEKNTKIEEAKKRCVKRP